MQITKWLFNLLVIGIALVGWFWTQAKLGQRQFQEGRIGDALLELTAPVNRFLHANPAWANRLLLVSSGLIDLLGVFLIASSIFGPSLRPFIGLFLLFTLRQLCQNLCALPPPPGMLWRHPGFPSLLVTYGTAGDLFFSGHTAIAVYGALELGYVAGLPGMLAGGAIALFEIGTVLVLRAHYTMDVFTGIVTALLVWGATFEYLPRLTSWLA